MPPINFAINLSKPKMSTRSILSPTLLRTQSRGFSNKFATIQMSSAGSAIHLILKWSKNMKVLAGQASVARSSPSLKIQQIHMQQKDQVAMRNPQNIALHARNLYRSSNAPRISASIHTESQLQIHKIGSQRCIARDLTSVPRLLTVMVSVGVIHSP